MSQTVHQLGAAFARWAPRVLIDEHLHEKMVEASPHAVWVATSAHSPSGLPKSWEPDFWRSLPPAEASEILARLGSHPPMESAWKKIRKVAGDDFEHAAFYFSRMAISYIALYQADKRRTPKERKKHFAKIQKAAGHLDELMSDCLEFNRIEISKFLSTEELDKLTHNLIHLALDDVRRNDSIANRLPLDEASVRQSMDGCLRNFSNLLAAVQEEASPLAETPGMSKHTAGLDAEVHYFISRMAGRFLKKFGEPMDSVTLGFAQALYPSQTLTVERIARTRQRKSVPNTKIK